MRRAGLPQLLAIVFVTLGMFLVSASSAKAAFWDDWFSGYSNASKNVDQTTEAVQRGEKGNANFRHHVDSQIINLQGTSLTTLVGPSQKAMNAMSPEDRQMLTERYGKGGAIGTFADGVTALYTPPASARTYVADLMHSAHMIPQAQAQGLGFAALDPVLQVWKMFRNLAYLVFVILFIVIGFMIMFRQKIGQTAVTVQQAIPNIIVSLLFVTFSYAIAGLAIDLMYLLMYLLVGMFQGAQAQDIMQYSFFDLGWAVLTGKNAGGQTAFGSVFDNIDAVVQAAINMDGIGETIGGISGLTAAVIMAVALLIGIFKLFFELLKTYVFIVLSIAFAPLILMMGALPGRNAFKTWITNLVGNLLAFPTVLMIVIVYRMFASVEIDTGGFLPPFLIGRGVGGTITTLVGVGIVLIMPELVAEMKKAMGVTGGVFEQLGKAMVTNFGSGAPIGTSLLGAPAGAALGAIGTGATEAWRNKANLLSGNSRRMKYGLYNVARGGGRGAVFGMSDGINRGLSLGKRAGSTPSGAGFVEKAIEGTGKHLSEEAYLGRVANRQNFFGLAENAGDGNKDNRQSYQYRLKTAKGRAEIQRQKEERERSGTPDYKVEINKK